MSGPNVTRIGARLGAARQADGDGNHPALGKACPVYALGIGAGNECHFLPTSGIPISVAPGRLNGGMIQLLFAGREDYLREHWPRLNKEGEVIGFVTATVASALLTAAEAAGIFAADLEKVRGRGAHAGADGDVIFHCGNRLWARGRWERWGMRDDGRIYPRGVALAGPHSEEQGAGPSGPAAIIEDLFRRWNWVDGVSPRLLLGFCCMSVIGGAIDWRSHAWITAPHGAGKSTLLRHVAAILGDMAYKVADATAAGLRTKMGYDALTLIMDEAGDRAEEGGTNRLVELTRIAASGDVALRGTAEHGSVEFRVKSPFLFASIGAPPMKSQDLSRFAILKMQRVEDNTRPPVMDPDELAELGRRLLRRMLDNFPRLKATYQAWRESLAEAGVSTGHDGEQYATLLACADIGMWDETRSAEERAKWAARVAVATAENRAEQLLEWQRVLQQITRSTWSGRGGGEQVTLGHLISVAARDECMWDADAERRRRPTPEEADKADRTLQQLGLKVVFMHAPDRRPLRCWEDDPVREPAWNGTGDFLGWLAVANTHAGLNAVAFRGLHWQQKSGTAGGWKPALTDIEGAEIGRTVRMAGQTMRCVMVPLEKVRNPEGLE